MKTLFKNTIDAAANMLILPVVIVQSLATGENNMTQVLNNIDASVSAIATEIHKEKEEPTPEE